MKSLKLFIPICIVFIILAACGNTDEQGDAQKSDEHENHSSEGDSGESLTMLEVDLQAPESVKKGEAVELKAMVTYGDEHVSDADEVMFEVWKEGSKDDSEMMKATNDGDGMYSVEKTFEEEGTYFVQSHVTARDMHNMPKKEIHVSVAE